MNMRPWVLSLEPQKKEKRKENKNFTCEAIPSVQVSGMPLGTLRGGSGELQAEGPLLMVVWCLGSGYSILSFDLPKSTMSL